MDKLQEQLKTELNTITRLKEEFFEEEGTYVTVGGHTTEGNRYIDSEVEPIMEMFETNQEATAKKRQRITGQLEEMMKKSEYYSVKYFCAMLLGRQDLESLFDSYIKKLREQLTSSDPEEKQRAILDLKTFYTHPKSSKEMIEASGKLLHYSNLRISFRIWFNKKFGTFKNLLGSMGCAGCLSAIIVFLIVLIYTSITGIDYYYNDNVRWVLLVCVIFGVICWIFYYYCSNYRKSESEIYRDRQNNLQQITHQIKS